MSNKWCTLFDSSREGVELRLRGGCSRASSVKQMVYFVQGLEKRSQASIKGRLFEGSIDLKGDSIVYFCSRGVSHGFISKKHISITTRLF